MSTPRTRAGESVSKAAFGATLTDQGRGLYVGLELLALLRGSLDASGDVLPRPSATPIKILRRSHDFARRLMADKCELADVELKSLGDRDTYETLRALYTGLRVPIPGRRKRPDWLGEHFMPSVGELVHYDAAWRAKRKKDKDLPTEKRVSIERYTYRGAGGLAHKVLRVDPDAARWGRVRDGLRALVADSETPLGRLSQSLLVRDQAEPDEFEEMREHEALVQETRWTEGLRSGIERIVARPIPPAKKAEAVIIWSAYCVARHQLERAATIVDEPEPHLPVDMGSVAGPIRRRSSEAHERARSLIVRALEGTAGDIAPEIMMPGSSKKWRDQCRNFFSGTLGSIGCLNAITGKRHFTFRLEFLETMVYATLGTKEEIQFERFCRKILFERQGLVVDAASAGQSSVCKAMNRSAFNDNENRLVDRLETLGLLHRFSDQTRMVSTEVW